MSEPLALRLTVNGEDHALAIAPFETLIDSLRERLALTGTKKGCNQGVCGACTVMIDGAPQRSCLSLTANCAGKAIETVEGLADAVSLSVVQQAFVDAAALQCGFCTPGMVVTVTALLRADPSPSRETVRQALSGNLCRCTGYASIIDATLLAAERMNR